MRKGYKIFLGIIVGLLLVASLGFNCYNMLYNNKCKDNNNECPKCEEKECPTTSGTVNNKGDFLTNLDYRKVKNIKINGKELFSKKVYLQDDAEIDEIVFKNDLTFIDINDLGTQFETHYLVIIDTSGNNVFNVTEMINDNDNDSNAYKYDGFFEFKLNNKNEYILSFYTRLWLGEGDESTGKAFNNKRIPELTKNELNKLGNYSDKVKYEYKYENNKFNFVKKTEINKLKDNEYYKEYFK